MKSRKTDTFAFRELTISELKTTIGGMAFCLILFYSNFTFFRNFHKIIFQN